MNTPPSNLESDAPPSHHEVTGLETFLSVLLLPVRSCFFSLPDDSGKHKLRSLSTRAMASHSPCVPVSVYCLSPHILGLSAPMSPPPAGSDFQVWDNFLLKSPDVTFTLILALSYFSVDSELQQGGGMASCSLAP